MLLILWQILKFKGEFMVVFTGNIQSSLQCKQGSLCETLIYNFLWYMKQNLQLPVSIWKVIPTCYHRNKGEVYIIGASLSESHTIVVYGTTCID